MKEKLERMHLNKRLNFGYRTVIGLMLFSGIVSMIVILLLFGNMKSYINKVERTDTAVKICRINTNIAARGIREMLLNDDKSSYPGYRQLVEEKLGEIGPELEVIKQAEFIDDSLYKRYVQVISDWGAIGYEIMDEVERGQHDEAEKGIFTECTPALDELIEVSKELDTVTEGEKADTIGYMTILMIVGIVSIIIWVILAVIISMRIGSIVINSVMVPLQEIQKVAGELAAGNLHSTVEYDSKDEIGSVASSLSHSIHTLSAYVSDIDRAMTSFAQGNFDVKPSVEWKGDFIGIKNSFEQFMESISEALRGVREASVQVSGGAEQVAASATDLAQGATDQAAVVEELTATLASVAERVSNNAEYAASISRKVQELGTQMLDGNGKMHEMVNSMAEINESSNEIGKIIATINEIASQTNLLALNASIEAARAGEAGRGFAVVADQVTVLADQSASAAKESASLIDGSVKAVERGMQIAEETAKQLEHIAKSAETIMQEVGSVAEALESQTSAIWQINEGVEHINDVVQSNSAASEECAATSEEMSSEADTLEALVGGFTIIEK